MYRDGTLTIHRSFDTIPSMYLLSIGEIDTSRYVHIVLCIVDVRSCVHCAENVLIDTKKITHGEVR